MSMPARSTATTLTGWGMVLSGAGAVAASVWGVSPYPPLVPELLLAGLAVVCAVGWVTASYRAAARARDPLSKPYRESRKPNPVLPYLVSFGVPVATFAAILTAFTVSSSYGRETERLEAVGYDEYEVTVVRLAGKPEFHEGDQDRDPYYLTDLTLRIPYESGPREVTVPGVYTRHKPPAPGTEVEVHYAPRDPGTPVTDNGKRSSSVRFFLVAFLGLWIWPLILITGFGLKSYASAENLHRLRRFRPFVHLPAFGILLTGVVMLLPTALELEAAGYALPLALLSCLTPALATVWMVKTA
ncbi:hypothetical protein ACFT5C_20040 [Streptomyces sp. NPDC057116]|uniref:hypothetical protein n=1 Tax=Streptomyces sp. NPDC057116 TaxID=3346023 RepID=UPI003637E933